MATRAPGDPSPTNSGTRAAATDGAPRYLLGMAIIELSHVIRAGEVTHPGLPAPAICDFLSREASRARYAPGVEFQIGRIEMVANTGTYVDTPFHRYGDGADLASFALDRLVDLEAVVIHAGTRAIDARAFAGRDLRGRAVLVHTGWSRHFGKAEYGATAPHLTEDAARALLESKAAFVAIDSVNIDSLEDPRRPVHSLLLRAGMPIGEHFANLAAVPDGARIHAAPARIEGMGTFPVRAYAITGAGNR